MSISDVADAMESAEFNLDGTTSMDSTLFCRVCPNNDHKLRNFSKSKTLHFASEPTTRTSQTGRTDKPRQAANSPANNHGTNQDKVAGADGAATIRTRPLKETAHLRTPEAKPRAESTPILQDARELHQTTETSGTATTLPVRVRHL